MENNLRAFFNLLVVLFLLLLVVVMFIYTLRLVEENAYLRVINSTSNKMTYKTPVSDDELKNEFEQYIIPACRRYNVNPFFLLAIRKQENGRLLYEMGCNNILDEIKTDRSIPVEGQQYYMAAYIIAKAQRDFCMDPKYRHLFIDFLADTYTGETYRSHWRDNVKVISDKLIDN